MPITDLCKTVISKVCPVAPLCREMSSQNGAIMRLAQSLALAISLTAGGFASISTAHAETKTAIFAGGCFWCIEKDFEQVRGVVDVVSGYTGGKGNNPSYQNHSGFLEAVKITYNPAVVSYESLLGTFWRTVDPTDPGGQFCDRGHSYTTAVFAANAMEKELAAKTKAEAAKALGKSIVTPIRDAAPFYNSEDYHQDYYKKNPSKYKYYRWSCGRNQTVEKLWGAEAYQGVAGHGS
jgi:peptide-methionine (S)-S-oxide reductase